MPRFVPVTDVEKPRSEQSSNDPDYSKHRKFDSTVQGIRRESSEKNKFEKSEKKKIPLRYEDMDPFERRKAMKEAKAKGTEHEDLNQEKADNYGERDNDLYSDRERSKDRENDQNQSKMRDNNRDNNRVNDRDYDRNKGRGHDRDRHLDRSRDSDRNRDNDRGRDIRSYERSSREKDERTDRNNRSDRKDTNKEDGRDERDERRSDNFGRSYKDKNKVDDTRREREKESEGGGLKEMGVEEMNNLRHKLGLGPLSNGNQDDVGNQWAKNEDVQFKRKKID
jgi:hypothetical protein